MMKAGDRRFEDGRLRLELGDTPSHEGYDWLDRDRTGFVRSALFKSVAIRSRSEDHCCVPV
jgi:hypothetical protein